MPSVSTLPPIVVTGIETEFPWVSVLADRMPEVRQILDSHGIQYWVSNIQPLDQRCPVPRDDRLGAGDGRAARARSNRHRFR